MVHINRKRFPYGSELEGYVPVLEGFTPGAKYHFKQKGETPPGDNITNFSQLLFLDHLPITDWVTRGNAWSCNSMKNWGLTLGGRNVDGKMHIITTRQRDRHSDSWKGPQAQGKLFSRPRWGCFGNFARLRLHLVLGVWLILNLSKTIPNYIYILYDYNSNLVRSFLSDKDWRGHCFV